MILTDPVWIHIAWHHFPLARSDLKLTWCMSCSHGFVPICIHAHGIFWCCTQTPLLFNVVLLYLWVIETGFGIPGWPLCLRKVKGTVEVKWPHREWQGVDCPGLWIAIVVAGVSPRFVEKFNCQGVPVPYDQVVIDCVDKSCTHTP